MFNEKLYERILSKVAKDPFLGCWNWTGPYHKNRPYPGNRYGYISIRRGTGKWNCIGTHRAMWIALHGEIPKTTYICHRCDNPLCVNPEHLFSGAAKDNTHDMLAKNRHNNGKKTHCKRGHPLSGDNVYVAKGGVRHCKTCSRMRSLRRWHNNPEFRRKQLENRRKRYATAKRTVG